ADRPLPRELEALGEVPGAVTAHVAARRLAPDPDVARAREDEAEEDGEERRLPRAVRAHDAEDAALRDGDGHIPERLHHARGAPRARAQGVTLRDSLELDQRFHSRAAAADPAYRAARRGLRRSRPTDAATRAPPAVPGGHGIAPPPAPP